MSQQGNADYGRKLNGKSDGVDDGCIITNKITKNARNPMRRLKKRVRQETKKQIRNELNEVE